MNICLTYRRRICIAAWFFTAWGFSSICAQDPASSSLAIVPRDASFYFSSMNHATCWHALVDSNAYKRLLESPVGEKMRKAYRRGRADGFDQFGENNPLAQYLNAYADVFANPGTKFAMPFLREIFRNEIFVYGDANVPKFLDALEQVQLDLVKLGGLGEDELPAEILKSVETHLNNVELPTIVVGTVLSDPSNLTDLMRLARSGLEKGLQNVPASVQLLVDGYRVIEDETTFLLTMTVDVNSVPWDSLELEENAASIVDGLRAIFRDKKLTLAVGVKDHFLIATVGPSLDYVSALGDGPHLVDLPRLAPLKSALGDGKSLTGAYYFSAAYLRRSTNFSGAAEVLPAIVEAALRETDDEAAKQALLAAVRKDAPELVADLGKLLPTRGDAFGFSFLTDQGIEGFQYDFSEQRFQDSSKPLDLFQHAGENPALLVVSRGKGTLEQFQVVQKWGGIGFDYAEKFIPEFGGESDDAQQALEFLSALKPFLKRLGDITAEKVIPATLGGESAIVVDFVESRHQWHSEQPASSQSLPLPSLSIVMQTLDSDQIKAAGREYFELARDIVEWIRTLPEVELPAEFQLIPPEATTTTEGEMYSYPLPEAAQLDESILPHALLANGLLVFSYFPERSKAIVAENHPQWIVPLELDRAAARGVYLNAHEFINAANNWLHYAVEVQEAGGQRFELKNEAENDLLDFERAELMETWDRTVDLFKCFRGLFAYSYTDADATITHYQLRFADIGK